MANVKITDLTELAAIDVATNDVLPIVDVNNDSTKKVTISSLTTSVAAANDYATYVQLNANIDAVQSNVSALSSVLRISNTGTTDDVTVGTDDLVFAGSGGLTPIITDNSVTFQLDDTAVTAGLYGGVEGTTTNVAVITVDAQGRITAASNATVAVDLATLESNVNTVQSNVAALETRRADNTFFTYNSTGDQANVIVNAANVEPSQNNIFSLGAPDKVWKELYVGPGSIKLGNVTLSAVETGLKIEDAAGETTQIDTSVANVTANLNLIQDNVNAVSQDVSALETRRDDNVTIRINAFTGTNAAIVAAESRLNSNLDVTNDNVTTLTTTVDNFGTSSNSNAAALASEDAALQSRLSTNVTALTNEDTALQSRLSTNVTAFTNEDTALQARLSTNVTAFTNEDTALQARIAANALVAASNDYITYTRLNANVDVVQDNVATLTTTVDNFGTSSNTNAAALASGIVASEVRVNANLDVTNDNVANITDGTTPFSAPVTFTDNVTISGSLIVTGAQVDLGVQSATVDNNFIELSAELAPGDAPATDSGLLINRGNKGNVFIGDHLGEDGVIFARTQTPDTNTIVAIESFMDLHANAIHVASPVNLNRVHVGLRASEDTGIIFDDSGANINFVADGSYVANVHYDGTLNSQNAIIAPAVFAGGVELQANDSATLFSARANDFATYTHITANVDVVQDNVATLTTTVDNHGTYSNTNFDTKANVSATFIQLNANVDVVQDNVAAAESNVSAVESRRVANIAGAVSTITTDNLTASRALASDGSGKVAVSAVTSTELGYLDGVTSAIQTQIDSKSSTSNAAALAAGIAGITPIGTSDIADNAVTVGKLAATLDLGALS